jgi:hypothetical protein
VQHGDSDERAATIEEICLCLPVSGQRETGGVLEKN